MNKKPTAPLSDETLNSLADNEFPANERSEILTQLQTDIDSKERVCEINHLKDQVRTAYQDIPEAPQNRYTNQKALFYGRAAAVLLALLIPVFIYTGFSNGGNTSQRLVMLDPDGRGQQLSQQSSDEMRVIFHVSNSTRLNADELLDDIEGLLEQYIANKQKVRIEVVAHASGLDLLRERLSTVKQRIASMAKGYPELTFVACLNTMERLKREQGIDVKLLSDAVMTQSGVAHVVKRQQQGWFYIQV